MADARAGQRVDRDAGAFECGFRGGERFIGDERIVGAVNEQRAGTRAELARQEFGSKQPAREADDAGNGGCDPAR